MNFFEHQDRAHRRTRLLVFLFTLATVAITVAVVVVVGLAAWYADPPMRNAYGVGLAPGAAGRWFGEHSGLFLIAAVGALGMISFGSLGKIASLRAGGGVVARSVGGVPVSPEETDPLKRRLMNVVAEMAIASGVPVPEVYVLEDEPGINAFAAGFSPTDAAIAVTRGSLEKLNRDELQGVVAHEFAHVLNGDMRLNMKLLGVLHGILLIGLTAQVIFRGALWGGRFGRVGGSRRKGGGGGGILFILAVAAALMVVGYVGVFFGRLIQAAVSRQRESLADASGVQFTRNPLGLAGALRKIGGYSEGSRLRAVHAEEVRHMLFGASGGGFASLFATHPPIEERIRALDPSFDPERERLEGPAPAAALGGETASAFAGGATEAAPAPPPAPAPAAADIPLDETAVVTSAGNPAADHVGYASRLLAAIPAELRTAAARPREAELLTCALLVSRDPAVRSKQMDTLGKALGEEAAATAASMAARLAAAGPEIRLPLLDLAFPSLKRLAIGDIARLLETSDALAAADGRYDLFEYVLSKLLRANLTRADRPSSSVRTGASLGSRRREAATVLAVMAMAGAEGDADWTAAWRAGADRMGFAEDRPPDPATLRFNDLDAALDRLDALSGSEKERFVRGLTAAVAADGRVTVAEAELLRAVTATLQTPLPPLHAGPVRPAEND